MKAYTPGAGRTSLSLLLLFGLSGAANNAPIQLSSLPLWLLALVLGAWGVARMQHGPLLLLAKRWRGRGVKARRQALYRRASS